MKKILPVLLVMLVLFSLISAHASQEISNPYFYDANHMPEVPMTYRLRASNRITVDLSLVQEGSLTQDTVFSASASGGNGSYEYCFYLLDPNETSDEYPTGNPHGYRDVSTVSTFNYRLVVPGTYTVIAYVRDTIDKNWDAAATLTFTVEDKNARTTDAVVQKLADECIAAGCNTDFEKALWFHDWLINNACYDLTYSYYSADGVLIRGTGVCDSYSKAYIKLLNAVGISSTRVTNTDHAWNLVKLDGDWYHIDPTWDDPVVSGKETSKISGAEYHMYFGLPDRIMKLDRSFSSSIEANGIRQNYYLKTGKVTSWIKPFETRVCEELKSKGYSFNLSLPSYYQLENGKYTSGKEPVVYSITAYAMSGLNWAFDSDSLPIDFSYNISAKALSANIRFSPDTTLELPASLTDIGDEAFRGKSSYLEVQLPSGLKTIGANAFSNNSMLWKIRIPDSVISIADNAFSSSENVTIVCKSGSYAETFAKSKGIRYRNF